MIKLHVVLGSIIGLEVLVGTQEFAKFVARQQENATAQKNSGEILQEWFDDLQSLYKMVEKFLHEYIAQGSVSYEYSKIHLYEDALGGYDARRMDIKVGRQRISLTPIGTLIIGSKGRVDIEGSSGKAQILLMDAHTNSPSDLIKITVSTSGKLPPPPPQRTEPVTWVWKIVTNTTPRKFVKLDKEAFLALIVEIANG